MKNIIVALDYDPSAEKVAQAGYDLAKKLNAKLLLLHVVAEPSYYSNLEYSPVTGLVAFGEPGIVEAARNLKDEAKGFLEEFKSHLGDETIETHAAEGDFSEVIIDTIHDFNADLLVMGTHGRRGLEKLLEGNPAARLLNVISIPLLTVPTNTP